MIKTPVSIFPSYFKLCQKITLCCYIFVPLYHPIVFWKQFASSRNCHMVSLDFTSATKRLVWASHHLQAFSAAILCHKTEVHFISLAREQSGWFTFTSECSQALNLSTQSSIFCSHFYLFCPLEYIPPSLHPPFWVCL